MRLDYSCYLYKRSYSLQSSFLKKKTFLLTLFENFKGQRDMRMEDKVTAVKNIHVVEKFGRKGHLVQTNHG